MTYPKTLLSEILGYPVMSDGEEKNNTVTFNSLADVVEVEETINIYELMNRAKLWAWGHGFSIQSEFQGSDWAFYIQYDVHTSCWKEYNRHYAKTEQEGVLSTCEDILTSDKKRSK